MQFDGQRNQEKQIQPVCVSHTEPGVKVILSHRGLELRINDNSAGRIVLVP